VRATPQGRASGRRSGCASGSGCGGAGGAVALGTRDASALLSVSDVIFDGG
jgi:hypothetical protein